MLHSVCKIQTAFPRMHAHNPKGPALAWSQPTLLVPDSLHVFIFKKRFMQCRILWLRLGKQIKRNLIAPQSCSTPTPTYYSSYEKRCGVAPAAQCWPPETVLWLLPGDSLFLHSQTTSIWVRSFCRALGLSVFELCTSKRSRVRINATGSYCHSLSGRHCLIRDGTAIWI